MSKKNKKGGTLILGVLFGFIFGLFIAPKKGKDLRRDAKQKMKDVKNNPKETIKDTFGDVKYKISSLVDYNEDEDLNLSEEDIVISKTFDDDKDEQKNEKTDINIDNKETGDENK